MPRPFRRLLLLLVLPLGGCAVVTVTAAVAGATIGVAGAVVETGVELTGKAIGCGIDALREPGDKAEVASQEGARPPAPPASAASAAAAATAAEAPASRPAGAAQA